MADGAFVEDYRPATFVERGVAVPFTTPLLSSARARPGRRMKTEFVIANPSGGQGYYVLGWDGLLGLTKVTVHDRLLYEAMGRAAMITPSTIRDAAREVASGGAAGRPAARAARSQINKENDDRLFAGYLLTLRLLRQGGLGSVDWRTFNPSDPQLRSRTRAMLARLEPILGAGVETIFTWIDELSAIVAPVGFATGDYESRMAGILLSLRRLREELNIFACSDGTEAGRVASFVAEVVEMTLGIAERTLADCHAELEDLISLLRDWAHRRDRLLEIFGRPDWLLDGWQTIAALWAAADAMGPERKRPAALEIQRMVPVMPREASMWSEETLVMERAWNQRRWVRAGTDWRGGSHVVDGVARNELMKVMAA